MRPISTGEVEARHVLDAVSLKIESNGLKRTNWEKRLVQTWGAGQKGEWSPESAICKGCACEIDASPAVRVFGGTEIAFPSTVCDDCMELVRAHYDPEQARPDDDATKTPKWDQNCGERHKQVVLGEIRPTSIDWASYERVRDWTPQEPRGLILTGIPGCGKSSAYWALARKLEEDGLGPITLSSVDLARTLAEAGRDIKDVGWLYRCRVLMVDDLGKERASPAVASLLWEVLDRRLAANLPVIFTTNFDGDGLAARFGESHLGDSIRRRIAELCRVVKFRNVNEKAA